MTKESICNSNNPCSGKYRKCLDVILTNACNAKCVFCVQRNNTHYIPKGEASVKKLAKIICNHRADNILLVGGEPTMYSKLGDLLPIITQTKKVYLTTNGSLLSVTSAVFRNLQLLSGMNISIHSPSEKVNTSIFGLYHQYKITFDEIRDTVKWLKDQNPTMNIRINCNLSKSGVCTLEHVKEMANLANHLGIDKLRIAELQGISKKEGFVFAKDIFLSNWGFDSDPFTSGCEKNIFCNDFGIDITVRRVCGIVSKVLPPVINPVGRKAQTQVLQPDGVITEGFTGLPDCHKNKKDTSIEPSCHGNGRRNRLNNWKESESCHGGSCHGRR